MWRSHRQKIKEGGRETVSPTSFREPNKKLKGWLLFTQKADQLYLRDTFRQKCVPRCDGHTVFVRKKIFGWLLFTQKRSRRTSQQRQSTLFEWLVQAEMYARPNNGLGTPVWDPKDDCYSHKKDQKGSIDFICVKLAFRQQIYANKRPFC